MPVGVAADLPAGEGRDTPAAARQYWRLREEAQGHYCETFLAHVPCSMFLPTVTSNFPPRHMVWRPLLTGTGQRCGLSCCRSWRLHCAPEMPIWSTEPCGYCQVGLKGGGASCGYSILVFGWVWDTEFCRDVSDLQVPQVAPVILPQLLRVLLQPQV